MPRPARYLPPAAGAWAGADEDSSDSALSLPLHYAAPPPPRAAGRARGDSSSGELRRRREAHRAGWAGGAGLPSPPRRPPPRGDVLSRVREVRQPDRLGPPPTVGVPPEYAGPFAAFAAQRVHWFGECEEVVSGRAGGGTRLVLVVSDSAVCLCSCAGAVERRLPLTGVARMVVLADGWNPRLAVIAADGGRDILVSLGVHTECVLGRIAAAAAALRGAAPPLTRVPADGAAAAEASLRLSKTPHSPAGDRDADPQFAAEMLYSPESGGRLAPDARHGGAVAHLPPVRPPPELAAAVHALGQAYPAAAGGLALRLCRAVLSVPLPPQPGECDAAQDRVLALLATCLLLCDFGGRVRWSARLDELDEIVLAGGGYGEEPLMLLLPKDSERRQLLRLPPHAPCAPAGARSSEAAAGAIAACRSALGAVGELRVTYAPGADEAQLAAALSGHHLGQDCPSRSPSGSPPQPECPGGAVASPPPPPLPPPPGHVFSLPRCAAVSPPYPPPLDSPAARAASRVFAPSAVEPEPGDVQSRTRTPPPPAAAAAAPAAAAAAAESAPPDSAAADAAGAPAAASQDPQPPAPPAATVSTEALLAEEQRIKELREAEEKRLREVAREAEEAHRRREAERERKEREAEQRRAKQEEERRKREAEQQERLREARAEEERERERRRQEWEEEERRREEEQRRRAEQLQEQLLAAREEEERVQQQRKREWEAELRRAEEAQRRRAEEQRKDEEERARMRREEEERQRERWRREEEEYRRRVAKEREQEERERKARAEAERKQRERERAEQEQRDRARREEEERERALRRQSWDKEKMRWREQQEQLQRENAKDDDQRRQLRREQSEAERLRRRRASDDVRRQRDAAAAAAAAACIEAAEQAKAAAADAEQAKAAASDVVDAAEVRRERREGSATEAAVSPWGSQHSVLPPPPAPAPGSAEAPASVAPSASWHPAPAPASAPAASSPPQSLSPSPHRVATADSLRSTTPSADSQGSEGSDFAAFFAEVTARPLDVAVQRYPDFRRHYNNCSLRRRAELREHWGPGSQWVRQRVRRCYDAGGFCSSPREKQRRRDRAAASAARRGSAVAAVTCSPRPPRGRMTMDSAAQIASEAVRAATYRLGGPVAQPPPESGGGSYSGARRL